MFYENSITYCFQIDSTSEMHSKCLSPKCHAKAIRFFKTSEPISKCTRNLMMSARTMHFRNYRYFNVFLERFTVRLNSPTDCIGVDPTVIWTNQLSITTEVTILVNQSIVYYYWSYDSCEPINCLLLLKLRFLWTNQLSITTELTILVNQSIVYYYWSYDSCEPINNRQLIGSQES
jgi:hypothetical protein